MERTTYDIFFLRLALFLAVGLSLFQLVSYFLLLPAISMRALHLGGGTAVILATIPLVRPRQLWSSVVDGLLILIALGTGLYVAAFHHEIAFRSASPITFDIVLAIGAVFLVLEISRRTVGWTLTFIGIAALAYALFGNHVPGMFGHRGHDLSRLVTHLFMSGEGIYGMPIAVSATIVYQFIIFGALLESTGAGKFFIQLAMALAGTVRGGIAKVAVLASALMGTISGTGTGNVVATGAVTIPMMKARGYKAHVAGAIECAASVAGPLLPPMMAAGAFIIPQFIGAQYRDVIIAAVVPALLLSWSVFWMIDFHACRTGMTGLPRKECPKLWEVLKGGWHILLVLAVVIYILVVLRMTPVIAVLYAISLTFLATLIKPMPGQKRSIGVYVNALESAAYNARIPIAATALAGIVLGSITLTGIGLVFASNLVTIAGDSLFLLLLVALAGSIFLGMGVPPVAAYIIVAVLVAPSLIRVGVDPMAAHLFVFWYGILALITPPICSAVFASTGISGAKPWPTAFETLKFSYAAFIIPLLFVYRPEFLLQGSLLGIVEVIASFAIGSVAIASAFQGYFFTKLKYLHRGVLLGGGVLALFPSLLTDIVGYIVLISAFAALYLAKIRTEERDAADVEVQAP